MWAVLWGGVLMNCCYCKTEAPKNIIFLRKEWVCPDCLLKPFEDFFPLKTVMEQIYASCKQVNRYVKLLYISELDNNLDKINKHFHECVNLDSPFCLITLTLLSGTYLLQGTYDFVFIDNDLNGKEELLNSIDIAPDGEVFYVEPIKQTVLTSAPI